MRPFLKWAGGKGQLLKAFAARLPESIKESKAIPRYLEPFVGGGAMFFYLKTHYQIGQAYLFDINPDLILCYKVLQQQPSTLITQLAKIAGEFAQKNKEERKAFYYEIRTRFNNQRQTLNLQVFNQTWIERACLLIFLNKTCYNGLYRLNQKGEFNVPYGSYTNPRFYDPENLKKIHHALQDTQLVWGDFEKAKEFVTKESFVYLDPPYRPLNATANFTAYSRQGFSDQDQKRLAAFYKEMDRRGAYLMLSNSDPKNEDLADNFFEVLYQGYRIERVPANRSINSDARKRGAINELIIRNY